MKAKYLRTEYIKYGGKYQVFEYRGKEYRVFYDKYGHYNGFYHDIKGEHIANQNEIDKVLDNKQPVVTEDAEKGFELFYKYCEEN
jgi:hypothetical protein